MDRKYCSHPIDHFSILTVQWCRRCSGWRVRRVGVDSGLFSASGSAQVFESHFLPQEETDPYDTARILQRALRAEQEFPNDGEQAMLFDYASHDAWVELVAEHADADGPLEEIVRRHRHDS